MDKQQLTDEQVEEKISALSQERIALTVNPSFLDDVYRHAEYHKLSVEDYCLRCIKEAMNQKAGKATIDMPNVDGGLETKVTGPTYSVRRVDNGGQSKVYGGEV